MFLVLAVIMILSAVLTFSSLASAVPWQGGTLNNGLFAYYKLSDNAASTNVIDSFYTYNGTCTNNTNLLSVPGIVGNALNFSFVNKGNHYVSIADNDAFSIVTTGAFSMAFWENGIKPPSGYADIIGKGVAGNHEWTLREGTGNPSFNVFALNGTTICIVGSNLTQDNNVWTMWSVTINSTSCKIYKNGVLAGTTLVASYGNWGLLANGAANTVIGTRQADIGAKGFNGTVDEVGFWNRVLTPDEVLTLYNSGSGMTYAPSWNSTVLKTVALNTSWGDTMVSSADPATNYGTAESMATGTSTTRSYIWFNLSKYTNVTFTNVTFNWYKNNGTNSGGRYYWCNNSFNELNLTWNKQYHEGINCNTTAFDTNAGHVIYQTTVSNWNYDVWSQQFYDLFKEDIQHGDGVWTFLILTNQSATHWFTKEDTGFNIPWLNLTYYDIFVVNSTYKPNIVENVDNAYNLTVKINASVSNVTAVFTYNGTQYTPSYVSSAGNWFNFTKSLRPASLTEPWNATRQLNWTINVSYVDGSSTLYTTNTQNQNVYRPVINMSNAPGNGEATRFFLCKDEVTLAPINCNFTSTWNIWAPENYANTYYRTYTNTTYQNDTFYKYPPASISNLTVNYNVSAVATGYPIRNFVFTGETLNNTNITKVFLMLSSIDGIYVTFQVLTQSYNPISGVYVTVNRTSDGGLIGTGTTGPTGTITFWMNPNIAHTIIFEHPSYPDVVVTDTFTQASYTIFMGATGNINVTNNYTGVSWQVTPSALSTLNSNQKYNFSLYLRSDIFNVSAFGYNLTDVNGNYLASNFSLVNATNITTMNFNISGNQTVKMVIWWIIDGTLTEPTVTWGAYDYYEGNYSIMKFIDDLRLYNTGPNPLFNSFTMSLIAFAIIFLITGAVCWVSGIYSPLAIGTMITSLTWFFAWAGMIGSPTSRTKYAIPLIMTLLFGAYYIWEQTR